MVGDRNKTLYYKVLKLRKSGKSYNKISKTVGVSKSTLSNWLSGKKWSDSITIHLAKENRKSSYDALIKYIKLRHKETLKRHEIYRIEAVKDFNELKSKNLFLIGLALYWGEGDKTNQSKVAVINSDVNLLKIIVSFYRRILKIPETKLRAGLFIHEDIDEEEAIKYWSSNLGLNNDQFIKTQVLPSRSHRTKSKVKYGMCNIYFSSVEINIKMKEWIKILARYMRA